MQYFCIKLVKHNNLSALWILITYCSSTRASVATEVSMHLCLSSCLLVNTLRPRQNGRHFADDIFKCIFLNENAWISLKISLKFVPKVRINNIPALVQIMAWRRPGDKPLSEPMMDNLLTHISVTRPQWVKQWHLRPIINIFVFMNVHDHCSHLQHALNWQNMFSMLNSLRSSDTIWRCRTGSTLVQVINMSPVRHQAVIWTNVDLLLIGPLGTNFSDIMNKIQTFSQNKMHMKMLSPKWQPFCSGPTVLKLAEHVVHA